MILIVEDDADNAAAIRDVLEDEGHQVSRACDGVDALRLLGEGLLPQLMIVDFMMPNLDGSQLAKRLRADARWSAIPLVLLTANGRAAMEAAGSNVDVCMHKPVNLMELLDVVQKYTA
jgi:CheY-like chemotaxis protein